MIENKNTLIKLAKKNDMEFGENIKMFNYKITGDPTEADHKQHYSEEIQNKLNQTYLRIQKGKIRNPQDIIKLIKRYPNIPAFKNYLSIFYANKGKFEKAMNVNIALVEEHPDYLFGKLNMCAKYLQDENFEEIPKVLGEALDLKDLYPNRNIFHITEFSSFLNISCRYLICIRNFEAVKSRLEPTTQILGNDDPVIQNLNRLLDNAVFNYAVEQYTEKAEQRDIVRAKSFPKDYAAIQTTTPPSFHHPEILELYKYGIDIERGILEKIFALPRTTLLEDLEKVLLDSISRFDYFSKKYKIEEEQKTTFFPLHALFLITELGGKEKLPMILRHLSERDDIIYYWYSDHLYETLWQLVYRLAQDDLEQLKTYQLDSSLGNAAKIIIHQVVNQIAFHQPEREKEVLKWYHEVLNYILENVDDPLICDPDVVSNIIAEVCDFSDKTFLPKIKVFYDKGIVDPRLPGDYEEVESAILDEDDQIGKYDLFDNIYDHYHNIVTIWSGYETIEDREKRLEEYKNKIAELEKEKAEAEAKLKALKEKLGEKNLPTTVKPDVKVGRNEPCPCGSGKKYKKCCY